jgi:hypothetical protein
MLHVMVGRRRGTSDSLNPVNEMRWLVIRDRLSRAIEYRELWPRTDLHAVMDAERRRLAAEGWTVDDIPKNCSFFFADRSADSERVCVSVECFEPTTAGLARTERRR